MKKRSSLVAKFVIGFLIIGIAICTVTTAMGYSQYKSYIQKKYNNIAVKPVIHPDIKYCNLLWSEIFSVMKVKISEWIKNITNAKTQFIIMIRIISKICILGKIVYRTFFTQNIITKSKIIWIK